jgi:hypothetical protein
MTSEEWRKLSDAWHEKAKKLQAEIMAETGTLDLREYRRRLAETGMMAEYEKINQQKPEGVTA